MTDITSHRIHVNVQIEGNTNSHFLAELGSIYGAEHVLVYKVSHKKFIRLSELPLTATSSLLKIGKELLGTTPFFNQNSGQNISEDINEDQLYTRRELPSDTAVVYGFFTPSIFKGIIDNPFVSIILKDPLERMISLYEEWKNDKGNTDWRVYIPFDKNIQFTDFVYQDGLSNYQSKCLGSQRLGDYDLVGVAECQSGFIAQLKNKDWTGYINQNNSDYNLEKSRYKNLDITKAFVEEFQMTNHMDYSIYQQAKEFMGYC